MKQIPTTLLLLSLGATSLNTLANEVAPIEVDETSSNEIGFDVRLGTLGTGIELDYAINPSWNTRLQLNAYTYSDVFEEDGIEYDGEIELSSVGALVDWRPFQGVFRLTAGVYSNNNQLSGAAQSYGEEQFEIGDLTYIGSELDPLSLATSVELGDSTAGYLGMGWGNSYPSGFLFSFEVGVLFSGSPQVQLTVDGTATELNSGMSFDVNDMSNPLAAQLHQELDKEVANLEEDISDFEVYPVIALGIGYRF